MKAAGIGSSNLLQNLNAGKAVTENTHTNKKKTKESPDEVTQKWRHEMETSLISKC